MKKLMNLGNKRIFFGIFLFSILFMSIISASLQYDFFSLVNAERARLGKPILYINQNLEAAAYLHSKDMGDNDFFSHASLDGRTFSERIKNNIYTNYIELGENIAYSSGNPDANGVFNMWKNSPGHYANMMRDFNEGGLGIYYINGKTYYTLDLGKKLNFIPPNLTNSSNLINNTPFINNTSPAINNTNPVNNTVLENDSLFKDVKWNVYRTNQFYRYIEINGIMNNKSLIYYKINNKERKICSSCDKFFFNIRTGFTKTKVELIVKNKAKKIIEKKIIDI